MNSITVCNIILLIIIIGLLLIGKPFESFYYFQEEKKDLISLYKNKLLEIKNKLTSTFINDVSELQEELSNLEPTMRYFKDMELLTLFNMINRSVTLLGKLLLNQNKFARRNTYYDDEIEIAKKGDDKECRNIISIRNDGLMNLIEIKYDYNGSTCLKRSIKNFGKCKEINCKFLSSGIRLKPSIFMPDKFKLFNDIIISRFDNK